MLGNFVGDIAPRFVKRYAEVGTAVEGAFRAYARDVRSGAFPGPEHCYPIDPADEALIHAARRSTPAPAAEGPPRRPPLPERPPFGHRLRRGAALGPRTSPAPSRYPRTGCDRSI